MSIRAYHFVGDTLRGGRPVPADGEWLEHEGPIELCKSGLHASRRPWHALTYAPGPVLCLVEIDRECVDGDDKLVARRRMIVQRVDLSSHLRAFAREEALRVIHLWDAPTVVRQYLSSGDESLRGAARAAAWAAARAAARAAAWAAARDAAQAAAWAAAWAAARAAAWAAVWAAAGQRFDALALAALEGR